MIILAIETKAKTIELRSVPSILTLDEARTLTSQLQQAIIHIEKFPYTRITTNPDGTKTEEIIYE